jgi:DNA-binding NarL/FixJ family response regulator
MKNKKKIFIVDDHPIVCEGLEQLINQDEDLCVCGHAGDASTAMKAIGSLMPDLVIVDVSLNGKSGIELMSEIKLFFPEVYILALSMYVESLIVDRALKAGAMGYVSKQDATTSIIKAIKQVFSGTMYLSNAMSEKLLDTLYGKKTHPDKMLVEKLSRREFEVFRLIGQGLNNHEIAESLHLSIKTVETHREHIKEKMNLKSAHELLRYAFRWSEQI